MEQNRNLAEATAVIAFALGTDRIKLGNEGVMKHLDLIVQIAEAFIKEYPEDFDWETFYANGGDDWDVVCVDFAEKYVKKTCIHVDKNYFAS